MDSRLENKVYKILTEKIKAVKYHQRNLKLSDSMIEKIDYMNFRSGYLF